MTHRNVVIETLQDKLTATRQQAIDKRKQVYNLRATADTLQNDHDNLIGVTKSLEAAIRELGGEPYDQETHQAQSANALLSGEDPSQTPPPPYRSLTFIGDVDTSEASREPVKFVFTDDN